MESEQTIRLITDCGVVSLNFQGVVLETAEGQYLIYGGLKWFCRKNSFVRFLDISDFVRKFSNRKHESTIKYVTDSKKNPNLSNVGATFLFGIFEKNFRWKLCLQMRYSNDSNKIWKCANDRTVCVRTYVCGDTPVRRMELIKQLITKHEMFFCKENNRVAFFHPR